MNTEFEVDLFKEDAELSRIDEELDDVVSADEKLVRVEILEEKLAIVCVVDAVEADVDVEFTTK